MQVEALTLVQRALRWLGKFQIETNTIKYNWQNLGTLKKNSQRHLKNKNKNLKAVFDMAIP